jgi:hypothetical protein
MGTKSTAKLLKMIPREIRAIIMERPILTSECQDEYDNLLLCFAETYKPKDLLQWFDVKRACVLSWEEQRMHRIMPAIIETAPVVEEARSKEAVLIQQCKSLAADHPDKFDKKTVQQAIKQAKVPARIIEAKAFIERMPELEALENLKLSNEARQRLAHQALAEWQTIEVLPQMANDNEEEPAKLTIRHQDEDKDDRGDGANRNHVEAADAAVDADQEQPSDEAEANEEQAATREASVEA